LFPSPPPTVLTTKTSWLDPENIWHTARPIVPLRQRKSRNNIKDFHNYNVCQRYKNVLLYLYLFYQILAKKQLWIRKKNFYNFNSPLHAFVVINPHYTIDILVMITLFLGIGYYFLKIN
jgi:hypothetical protein